MGSSGNLVPGRILGADDIEVVDVIELPEPGVVNHPICGIDAFWYGLAGPYDPSCEPTPVGRPRCVLAALVGRIAEGVQAVAWKLDEWRERLDPNSGPRW